ncbi:hypothetical protein BC629DRAFT_1436537 [Irpex lacteus]|nr:hypothetical protein BC629DRAFT_1436537 [Irpex lacteus]
MSTSQDDLWCPVDAGTEVRIETVLCKKSIDMCFQKDTGSRLLSQYENIKNTNQMWKLERVGSIGYLIRHVDSGLCLIPTTVGKDGRVYTDVGPLATRLPSKDTGIRVIHLAEKKEYTLTVEGSSEKTGARYVLWPHGGGAASKWYIKDFYDLN